MGDIQMELSRKTLAEFATEVGRNYDTVFRAAKRVIPGTVSAGMLLTPEMENEISSAMRSGKSVKKKTGTVRRPAGNTMAAQGTTARPNEVAPPVAEKNPGNPKRDYRKIGLIALTVAPFLASVDNMFHVTRELTNPFSAVCLTVLVCVSAVGFTVANSRHKVAIAVTVATVAFEAFCNLTRIYGGLMTGASGNPTKFVGLVTDILGTGTHETAIFVGAVTALLISGVQYAAIFEMNKPAPTRIGA